MIVARRAWAGLCLGMRLLVCLVVVGVPVLLAGCDWPWSPSTPGARAGAVPAASPGPRRIRFLADSSTSIGLQMDRDAAAEFSRQTGIQVEVIPGPNTTTDRLAESELYLMSEAPD